MTEQPSSDDFEPRSLPEGLGPAGSPNDLTPPEWKRTALIVWSLIGLVFFGGLLVMVLTWRDVSLPSLPDAPGFRFEMPDWAVSMERTDEAAEALDDGTKRPGRPPEDMEVSRGGSAESQTRIDKPGGEEPPAPGAQTGVLSGGTYGDAAR